MNLMALPVNQDIVKFHRAPDLADLEFLHATFVRHSFPRHTHETFAIGIIEKGVQATNYKGSTHIAVSGDICLVNPGEVHTGFPPHESGWTYRVCYPDAGLLEKVAKAVSIHGGGPPHFPAPVIQDAPLAASLHHFLRILESSEITLERESHFVSVLEQLILRHADTGREKPFPGRERGRRFKRSLAYLDAHFLENVTLSELSDIAGLSVFHFLRLFRATAGLPPHAYLIQRRIDYARCLLSQGFPIVHVSLEAGFADQSHFTRWFKKIVGVTPGQYRRASNCVQEIH
jgi:AraC-like DNA-binding protein